MHSSSIKESVGLHTRTPREGGGGGGERGAGSDGACPRFVVGV